MARSIPPPQNEHRSRSGGGGGRDAGASRGMTSAAAGPIAGSSSGGAGRSRDPRDAALRADRMERDRSGRPPARPPPHGYGDVRGQQYNPPRGVYDLIEVDTK